MNRRLLLGMVISVCARSVAAQSVSPFSLDATLGVGTGNSWSKTYYSASKPAFAATLGYRPNPQRARMFAINVGVPFASKQVLVLDIPTVRNEIRREFPVVAHVGVLGGAELGTRQASLRALVGPSWFGGDGASGLGGQIQLDAATGGSHVAFVISARGGLDFRTSGETLRLGGLGFGLRLR